MTNQEAIETMQANYPPENYTLLREALDKAVNLLKEQEPKLVKIDRNRGVLCPSCGNELFTYPRQKFCDECGQAVKWE